MSQLLAELVSLVTYGNMFLTNEASGFDVGFFLTRNCPSVDFIEGHIDGVAGSARTLAPDALEWFSHLKNRGVKRIKLHWKRSQLTELPDHISAAFVGGGSNWFVEVQSDDRSDLYLGEWIPPVGVVSAPWKTHFLLVEEDIGYLEEVAFTVSEGRERVDGVLEKLIEFAGKFENTKHWAKNFENARRTLTQYEPKVADEFLPAGIYLKETRQLIETVFRSWVFGGMGSWNDLAFSGDDQETYSSLSSELYSSLCQAIISAVNSYP